MSEDKPAELPDHGGDRPDHGGDRPDHGGDRPDHGPFAIVVNGRRKEVEREELSFDELVDLAFDDPARGPQIVFTITFRDAAGRIREGELDEGQRLKVRDGTIVNVTRTDQS